MLLIPFINYTYYDYWDLITKFCPGSLKWNTPFILPQWTLKHCFARVEACVFGSSHVLYTEIKKQIIIQNYDFCSQRSFIPKIVSTHFWSKFFYKYEI